MARRQLQIAGTERTDIPPQVDEAGEKWLELRKEQRRATERARDAKLSLIALMDGFKVPLFQHRDPDTNEMITLEVQLKPQLKAKKSGEVDSDVGDAVVSTTTESPGPHEGLINQAMKAQGDINVEENAEGDVVVPDTAEPKAKKPRKRKAK